MNKKRNFYKKKKINLLGHSKSTDVALDMKEKSKEQLSEDVLRESTVSILGGKKNTAIKTAIKKPLITYINKDLTYVLVEESEFTNKYAEIIKQIILNIDSNRLLKIISYSNEVKFLKDGYCVPSKLCLDELIKVSDEKSMVFYDAIYTVYSEIEKLRRQNKSIINFTTSFKYEVNAINLVVFGSSYDEGSKHLYTEVKKLIAKMVVSLEVDTKCISFSEEQMIHAASLGFRSIGSLNTTF